MPRPPRLTLPTGAPFAEFRCPGPPDGYPAGAEQRPPDTDERIRAPALRGGIERALDARLLAPRRAHLTLRSLTAHPHGRAT